ncbi:MAG: response regulator [Candidatus Binatia bacterium]
MSAERIAPPPEEPGNAPISARVLLVEDNVVNQKIGVAMLRKIGATVDVAADGREGVRMVEAFPYDLVFMDCQMPVMDGYTATAEIRRREPPGQHVPIVAMTAHAMAGDREKCLAAGMDDYASKPVTRPTIRQMLQRHVRRTPGTPTVRPSAAAESDVLDAVQVEDMRDLCPDDFREVVERYLARTAQSFERLGQAVRAAEANEVQFLAHDLAGAGATMGMKTIVAPLRKLEQAAREGRLDEVGSMMADAHREFERGREALLLAASALSSEERGGTGTAPAEEG